MFSNFHDRPNEAVLDGTVPPEARPRGTNRALSNCRNDSMYL